VGYFFLDDSKHPTAGFCLSSIVFTESDPQKYVEQILLNHGLQPGHDELKSSSRMKDGPANVAIRDDLKNYLRCCKVGVAMSPTEGSLYADSAALLQKMLGHSDVGQAEHTIFVDREIAPSKREQEVFLAVRGAERCHFHFEQDSKVVGGIQLADLSAHICAIMMKDSLGLITKRVRAGENSGYDPDSDMELGFEMFATIRYSFLGICAPYVQEEPQPRLQHFLLISDYGLQVSDALPETLRAAAESRFGSLYLGCIH